MKWKNIKNKAKCEKNEHKRMCELFYLITVWSYCAERYAQQAVASVQTYVCTYICACVFRKRAAETQLRLSI